MNTTIGEWLTCKWCGYNWRKRIDEKPKKCPACQSRKWDKEKKEVTNG